MPGIPEIQHHIGPLVRMRQFSSQPGTGNETTRGVSTIMGAATGWLWLVSRSHTPAFRVRVWLRETIGYGLDLRDLRIP